MFNLIQEFVNNKFSSSEGKEERIMSKVNKGKTIEVAPTSARFYQRNEQTGGFEGGGISLDPLSGGVRQTKPSTAVSSVKYNPETHICTIQFRGNPKSYDYSMSKQEFETFMNAPSKGQYVNEVMSKNNRIAGY